MENESQSTATQHSGSKYLRKVVGDVDGLVDVYAVLETFGVTCPARAHAIKKLLCSGIRGKGDALQDLRECADAIKRAIEIETDRQAAVQPPCDGAKPPLGVLARVMPHGKFVSVLTPHEPSATP